MATGRPATRYRQLAELCRPHAAFAARHGDCHTHQQQLTAPDRVCLPIMIQQVPSTLCSAVVGAGAMGQPAGWRGRSAAAWSARPSATRSSIPFAGGSSNGR